MISRSQTFEGVNLQYAQQCGDRSARRVIFNCADLDTGSVSVDAHSPWSTAAITLKKSNSINGPWTALTGVATLTPSAPVVDLFTLGYSYLLAETTAEGAACFVSISFNGKGS